ncbi:MAG: NAD(P)-dependent alcohol dehydrogenase [Flavobacteriales bacterium]|nr:NAD(P)-dependent alcohol dehydrogenase [Flavobacteriales bacterium]
MKAVTRNQYGPPDVLNIEDIKQPSPKSDELLIHVLATTVNRTDCAILRAKPFLMRAFTGMLKPKSKVPGTDFAGIIEEVGAEVSDFKVGDRIWGLNDLGLSSQAEYMVIKANQAISIIPNNTSFKEAVACAEGGHYAFNFLNNLNFNKDTKVLVNGATGAIGVNLVQLLSEKGVQVTAVGNSKNIELIKSLGAKKTIDYLLEDFTIDNEKYHYIFDAVGKSSFYKCRHLLLPKGIYKSSELGPYSQNLYLPLWTKIFNSQKVVFPIPKNPKRTIEYLTNLLRKNKLKAVIDREYSMENIKDAYDFVESGEKTGSVIIRYK